jgi:CheY-like chemotaxis protein
VQWRTLYADIDIDIGRLRIARCGRPLGAGSTCLIVANTAGSVKPPADDAPLTRGVPMAQTPTTHGLRRAPLVLLVEDDADVRSTLSAILHTEGWDLIIAADGFDALAALDQHDPDVVLLDWMMPVVDGPTFLRALREEYQRTTPVLVISAGRTRETAVRAAGADAYLHKPFEIDELMQELRRLAGGDGHGDGAETREL